MLVSDLEFLTFTQLNEILPNFEIESSPNSEFEIFNLSFSHSTIANEKSVAFQTPQIAKTLLPLCLIISSWLPAGKDRILWISSTSGIIPSSYQLLTAARNGWGEEKSIFEVPGMRFKNANFKIGDIFEADEAGFPILSVLASTMQIMIQDNWDGWLMSSGCTERIEFWEDYFIYYSSSSSKIEEAIRLMKYWDIHPSSGFYSIRNQLGFK